MKTKLTVIVDNKSDDELGSEWGLCILCEYGDAKILLDAGASDLFSENMKKLGFDTADVDYGVLSHAHYDHANGMPRFFAENKKAKFYLRESTGENCFARKTFLKLFTFRKYIGIPKHVTEKYADRIEYVTGDYKLCEGAYLIPHKTPGLSAIGERELMFVRTKDGYRPDDFSHEQSLVLFTDKGLVILNSCSHGGAVNIINEVKETFPDERIYGLIGGLHLFNKSSDEIRKVSENIKNTGIEYVCTGHCTKDRAYGIMKEVLGDRLLQLKTGLVMEF
ncbi:MAG: MBL fold metallo-hydrolase [Lachnospiraceae bacterium]|nr:MBL fold metallo-hydrolase [Lachnospiraceae bacterium]